MTSQREPSELVLYHPQINPQNQAWIHIRRTTGAGWVARISSIFSRTAGVNFGRTSSAFRLSRTCSGLLAPRMMVDVWGLTASHASARWEILQLSSTSRYDKYTYNRYSRWINVPVSANAVRSLIFLIFVFPSSEVRPALSSSYIGCFSLAKRESSGIPSLYWGNTSIKYVHVMIRPPHTLPVRSPCARPEKTVVP